MSGERVRVLVITGAPGVGKSTTAVAVSDLLAQRDIAHGFIDMDHVRWLVPGPESDPRNVKLGLKHLSMLAQSYRHGGAQLLIIADVVAAEEPRAMFENAIPDSIVTIVRLRLPDKEIRERIIAREPEGQHDWFMEKAALVAQVYDERDIGDFVIDCHGKSTEVIAREVLVRLDPQIVNLRVG